MMRAAILSFERKAPAGSKDVRISASRSQPVAVIDLDMVRRARVLKETLRRTLARERAYPGRDGTAA